MDKHKFFVPILVRRLSNSWSLYKAIKARMCNIGIVFVIKDLFNLE